MLRLYMFCIQIKVKVIVYKIQWILISGTKEYLKSQNVTELITYLVNHILCIKIYQIQLPLTVNNAVKHAHHHKLQIY